MNERAKIIDKHVLAKSWGSLTSYTMDYRRQDGTVQRLEREAYDHGSAAAILLYDPDRKTVLLVRQFRFAVMLNGDDAEMLEVCAGMLDGDAPKPAPSAKPPRRAATRRPTFAMSATSMSAPAPSPKKSASLSATTTPAPASTKAAALPTKAKTSKWWNCRSPTPWP
ncbi:NUDIX hydrolase [Devosia aurantiaca]|uniref:hypothetical protein n=1 Tax=Devosia aurantiaca TaxID=2714858 RepID=UPI002E2D2DDA|nr:hypothetical protein [Devosia aurantiaca]